MERESNKLLDKINTRLGFIDTSLRERRIAKAKFLNEIADVQEKTIYSSLFTKVIMQKLTSAQGKRMDTSRILFSFLRFENYSQENGDNSSSQPNQKQLVLYFWNKDDASYVADVFSTESLDLSPNEKTQLDRMQLLNEPANRLLEIEALNEKYGQFP